MSSGFDCSSNNIILRVWLVSTVLDDMIYYFLFLRPYEFTLFSIFPIIVFPQHDYSTVAHNIDYVIVCYGMMTMIVKVEAGIVAERRVSSNEYRAG
jgi:hypothetical protein